jgi:hypothetical protein
MTDRARSALPVAAFLAPFRPRLIGAAVAVGVIAVVATACGSDDDDDAAARQQAMIEEGKQIFRFDTFGDETKWTDTLRIHEVIETAVSPAAALAVGLKVDSEALPAAVVAGIQNGTVDLNDPATTVALLKLDAVVGLKGKVETINGVDRLTRVGTTCALCHSTVDDSFAPGIGKRLDGWPNRDLNPGAIIALSPAVDAAEKAKLATWGKGKYDPRHNIDQLNKPVVIPPAYGLAGVARITFTGDGENIAYWNRYVAVTQTGGQGTFSDARLNLTVTNRTRDLVSSKLDALEAYQRSLPAPAAPAGSFDAAAATRGKVVFEGAGQCATCHSGEKFTDAGMRLHPPADSDGVRQLRTLAAPNCRQGGSPFDSKLIEPSDHAARLSRRIACDRVALSGHHAMKRFCNRPKDASMRPRPVQASIGCG